MASESITISNELIPFRKKLVTHFKKKKYNVEYNKHIDVDKIYSFHLVCKKNYETIAIEIRENCNIESYFESRIKEFQSKRLSVKIYIAVPEKLKDGGETNISFVQSANYKKLGVGLFVIKEGRIEEEIGNINCNRRYVMNDGSSLGIYKTKIAELISDFNQGKCIPAIKDFSEQVEDACFKLALKAAQKGLINIQPIDITNKTQNWETIINCLSTDNYRGTQIKYFDANFSRYIKSYKDVRNLSDHPKGKKEKRELDSRLNTAMQDGINILRDLIRIKSRIK